MADAEQRQRWLSALEGLLTSVLRAVNSRATLDRCTISMESVGLPFMSPVSVDGGTVDISRTTITATGSTATPYEAITATNSSTMRLDPTATLTPSPGQLQLSGAANVVNTALMPLPWGDVWINLESGQQIPIDIGVLSHRIHRKVVATANFPVGLALSVQPAVLDYALTISNGMGFVAKQWPAVRDQRQAEYVVFCPGTVRTNSGL